MKKFATLLTVAIFAVSLYACTKKADETPAMEEPAPAAEVEVTPQPTPPPPAAEAPAPEAPTPPPSDNSAPPVE